MPEQQTLFARRARCGYCGRELAAVEGRYECPRCAPELRVLGRGMPYPEVIAEFGRFQRRAAGR